MTDPDNPAEALASIRAARGAVEDRLKVHWLYDVVYGVACGGVVASTGFPPPWGSLMTAACCILLALMVQWWRKQTGLWVSGISPRRARWVAYGLGAVLVVLAIAGFKLGRDGLWQGSLSLGVVGGVIGVLASHLWTRVYLRELREGA